MVKESMRPLSASSKAFLLLPFTLLGCSTEPLMFDASSAGSSGSSSLPPLPPEVSFGPVGNVSVAAGMGSFRFGAASAATQIEDQNTNTDWYAWTAQMPGGLGKGPFVGDASKGYTLALDDVKLLVDMHLDSYRFSIEWARVEPKQGMIDEAALDHYSKFIDALVAAKIRPMITIHHFSNPVWVADPRDPDCTKGPSAENLCGLSDKYGGAVVAALNKHAKLLAERFGDRVDDWCTLNEPINYLLAAYGAGTYPPGKIGITSIPADFIPVLRHYINAHVSMYTAIKAADKIDADGDGVPASVGFTHGAQEWIAARDGKISDNPEDVKARESLLWTYQYHFVEALRKGGFDGDFDGDFDEMHQSWVGKLDWLGVQYYFRAGVTGKVKIANEFPLTPCGAGFDGGACIAPLDPTYKVPEMKYEHNPAGLYTVLKDFHDRWPDLPLTVTESGIATEVGARRAEVVVRALEQIDRARSEGVDVRGYYHWSIFDNFEWTLGFTPRFGLYNVDYTTFKRTATEGATVLGEIAGARKLTGEHRRKYGGDGPMTPEK
jgi:beta-glucosidase/6-phospho-beta-glucosidase/beta-galactosidase